MGKTNIPWADYTINFWEGCTRRSPGCANCYAEARDRRHLIENVDHWGKGAPRRKSLSAVRDALRWNNKPWICHGCGKSFVTNPSPGCKCPQCDLAYLHRASVFALSMGDWLDEEVPIQWLVEMLDTIRKCDQLIWILCTKRAEQWNSRLIAAMQWLDKQTLVATADEVQQLTAWRAGGKRPDELIKRLTRHPTALWIGAWIGGKAPSNVWLLTSVENQEMADKRIPELLKIPARCHGLSLEPLLGPVDLEPTRALWAPRAYMLSPKNYVSWLIVGGESGQNARPCNIDWIRSIVAQGKAAGVATFVKQLGAFPFDDREFAIKTPEYKDKKGGDVSEWPEDLRIRQFPTL